MAKKTGGAGSAGRGRRREGYAGTGVTAAIGSVPGSPEAGRRAFSRRLRPAMAAAAALPLAFIGFFVRSAASAASNKVTITTDSDGVAHITAANFTALGYGEAWAFSRQLLHSGGGLRHARSQTFALFRSQRRQCRLWHRERRLEP